MFRQDGSLREKYQRVFDKIKKGHIAIIENSNEEKIFNKLVKHYDIKAKSYSTTFWQGREITHYKILNHTEL